MYGWKNLSSLVRLFLAVFASWRLCLSFEAQGAKQGGSTPAFPKFDFDMGVIAWNSRSSESESLPNKNRETQLIRSTAKKMFGTRGEPPRLSP